MNYFGPSTIYNFRRFGLTPEKIRCRFKSNAPIIFANSVPKSGTHLLESLLTAHPALYRRLRRTLNMANIGNMGGLDRVLAGARPGQVIVAHLWHRPDWAAALAGLDVKNLLMVRDPRDVAISVAHYIHKNPKHPEHPVFRDVGDPAVRLDMVLRGRPEQKVVSLRERIEPFLGWLEEPALLVRFEDLVGSAGGGSDETQLETVRRIFSHMGLPLAPDLCASIAGMTFSSASPTFRKGSIKQWPSQFGPEMTRFCEENLGDVIRKLGYGL